VGAALYLPETWGTPEGRRRGQIPAAITCQPAWRLAVTLLRQVRASGLRLTGVLADAEFGDNRMVRALLHRLDLPYAVGVSTHLRAFAATPALATLRRRPGSHLRQLPAGVVARSFADLLAAARPHWRRVQWRNAPGQPPWAAECTALRVIPGIDHRHPRLPPEIWLLAEREVGPSRKTRFYYINLPADATLLALARFAHQRWPIEQQYQELKTELGIDHFEGRTYTGWHHHVVLTAVAYNFLQAERRRRSARPLTFPRIRGIVQEIFTACLFAQHPHYLRRIEALRTVQLRI
jgi:SRSO17 transposase